MDYIFFLSFFFFGLFLSLFLSAWVDVVLISFNLSLFQGLILTVNIPNPKKKFRGDAKS